jgi:hypothetical protein
MKQSIPLVVEDEALFSHFVDETLLFDQELRINYDLSQMKSNCLQILAEQPYFGKWVALEKKCMFTRISCWANVTYISNTGNKFPE